MDSSSYESDIEGETDDLLGCSSDPDDDDVDDSNDEEDNHEPVLVPAPKTRTILSAMAAKPPPLCNDIPGRNKSSLVPLTKKSYSCCTTSSSSSKKPQTDSSFTTDGRISPFEIKLSSGGVGSAHSDKEDGAAMVGCPKERPLGAGGGAAYIREQSSTDRVNKADRTAPQTRSLTTTSAESEEKTLCSLLNVSSLRRICVLEEIDDLVLLHYDKKQVSECDANELSVRGIVVDRKQKRIVCAGWPHTEELAGDEAIAFMRKYGHEYAFFRGFSGTVVRFFHHSNRWYLSTHRAIDASQRTWERRRFLDIFHQCSGHFDIHWLSPDCIYVFLLCNWSHESAPLHLDENAFVPGEFVQHLDTFRVDEKTNALVRAPDVKVPSVSVTITEPMQIYLHPQWVGEHDTGIVGEMHLAQLLQQMSLIIAVRKSCTGSARTVPCGSRDVVKLYSNTYATRMRLRGEAPTLRMRFLELSNSAADRRALAELFPARQRLFSFLEQQLQRFLDDVHTKYSLFFPDDQPDSFRQTRDIAKAHNIDRGVRIVCERLHKIRNVEKKNNNNDTISWADINESDESVFPQRDDILSGIQTFKTRTQAKLVFPDHRSREQNSEYFRQEHDQPFRRSNSMHSSGRGRSADQITESSIEGGYRSNFARPPVAGRGRQSRYPSDPLWANAERVPYYRSQKSDHQSAASRPPYRFRPKPLNDRRHNVVHVLNGEDIVQQLSKIMNQKS